jgi:hypothetical protein
MLGYNMLYFSIRDSLPTSCFYQLSFSEYSPIIGTNSPTYVEWTEGCTVGNWKLLVFLIYSPTDLIYSLFLTFYFPLTLINWKLLVSTGMGKFASLCSQKLLPPLQEQS